MIITIFYLKKRTLKIQKKQQKTLLHYIYRELK